VAGHFNIGAGLTMNPHVHKALDGDISDRTLTTPERVEVAEAESQIAAVLRAVPVEPLPALAPAVLERIRRGSSRARAPIDAPRLSETPAARRHVADWLWRPRPISITWRPVYALAAAVMFVAIFAADSLRPRRAVVAARSQQVFTQFVLSAPDAKRVAVAGDFSSWQAVNVMTRSEAGVWTVVVPLDPGVHDYAFVVDGERWVPDPAAPAVKDGFGGVNSRVAVLSPDGGSS
jgi:hypothetical protein